MDTSGNYTEIHNNPLYVVKGNRVNSGGLTPEAATHLLTAAPQPGDEIVCLFDGTLYLEWRDGALVERSACVSLSSRSPEDPYRHASWEVTASTKARLGDDTGWASDRSFERLWLEILGGAEWSYARVQIRQVPGPFRHLTAVERRGEGRPYWEIEEAAHNAP